MPLNVSLWSIICSLKIYIKTIWHFLLLSLYYKINCFNHSRLVSNFFQHISLPFIVYYLRPYLSINLLQHFIHCDPDELQAYLFHLIILDSLNFLSQLIMLTFAVLDSILFDYIYTCFYASMEACL